MTPTRRAPARPAPGPEGADGPAPPDRPQAAPDPPGAAPGLGRPHPLQQEAATKRRRRIVEELIRRVLQACGYVSVAVSLGIAGVLVVESAMFFQHVSPLEFFFGTRWTPLLEPRSFGVLPLVVGTLMVAAVAGIFVIPVGSLAAMYLAEYARPRVRRVLKPVLEVLAGVPTVVYGYFAVTTVTPLLRTVIPSTGVFNALAAGLVVGVMIIPTVASLSDDALRAVPRSLRDAAHGLGATKHEVVLGVVFPSALSGVVASYILAISRAVGETMIVAMAAGATPSMSMNPLESIQTMTGYIVQVSLGDTPAGTVEYQTIFAVGLALFLLTLSMNLVSIAVKRRFQETYA